MTDAASLKIAAITKLIPREGRFEELCAAASAFVDAVKDEVGTEIYLVARTSRPADALLIFELFTDKPAQRAHAAAGGAVGALVDPLVESAEVLMGQPLFVKGLSI